jgi:hypothetical protein
VCAAHIHQVIDSTTARKSSRDFTAAADSPADVCAAVDIVTTMAEPRKYVLARQPTDDEDHERTKIYGFHHPLRAEMRLPTFYEQYIFLLRVSVGCNKLVHARLTRSA